MVEQPVISMVENAVVSTPIRTTALVASSTPVVPVSSQGVTPPPQSRNVLFNTVVARPLLGFSMPMNNRGYPYGMPTSMMVDLPTKVSMYSNNAVATMPLYNFQNAYA